MLSPVGNRPRFVETTRKPRAHADDAPPRTLVLVLAHHPALARIGETIPLRHGLTEIARLAPSLVDSDGRDSGPLDDPFVSRRAIRIRRLDGDHVELDADGVDVTIDGAPVRGVQRIAADDIARGVAITLCGRVVWWLTSDHDPRGGDALGLFGASGAMHTLRGEIRDAASARGPILVHGETGAGKELVARALHASGARAGGPYVGVNVAAIPAAVAAAELFGHERGAFTGATERRAGYFERAHGGVLFLDEIGELPDAIQPILLRALESGEIQPIGGAPRAVDALIVAATDADLEAAARAGRFRMPLFYRLAATVIDVPPLRERGADLAILLARWLCEALPAALADRTADPEPWLPASIMQALLRAPWPGNVRQLRNVALRLAAIARAGRVATLDALGIDDDPELDAPARDDAPRDLAIDDDRLVATLRAHRFQLGRTADALGISRSYLDTLIARSPRVRKAKQLERDEIVACASELDGDLDAVAARLEVSPRGLRLRMKQLGL